MIRNFPRIVLTFAFAVALGACVVPANTHVPPPGLIVQDAVMHSRMFEANNLGARRGESCVVSYGGLYTRGDAGIRAAAAAGAITLIKAVDYRVRSYGWFLYSETCTIAYGD